MSTSTKIKPGQRGTKKLFDKYGDKLLCVRYRYDAIARTCLKTVEVIIETKPWSPPAKKYKDNVQVPVRIGFGDKELREKAKAAKGKWDPSARVWYIQYGKIKNTDLEKFILS